MIFYHSDLRQNAGSAARDLCFFFSPRHVNFYGDLLVSHPELLGLLRSAFGQCKHLLGSGRNDRSKKSCREPLFGNLVNCINPKNLQVGMVYETFVWSKRPWIIGFFYGSARLNPLTIPDVLRIPKCTG